VRWTIALALVGSILWTGVARAQQQEQGPKVGEYAPDFEAKEWIIDEGDEVPSLAALRGMVVVVVFWVSWHDGGEVLMPYINEASSRFAGFGIMVVGLTDADAKVTKPLVHGAKAFWPVGCRSQSAKEYGFENGWGAVVIDPEGKIAYKGQPQEMNSWQQTFTEIFKKGKPTRTHPSEAKVVIRNFDAIRKNLASEQFRLAIRDTDDGLRRAVLGDKLRSEVLEAIDLMNLIGYDKLRKAEEQIENGQYKDAADAFRYVMRKFKGIEVAKDARKRVDELSKENDKFKEAINKYSDEDTAYKTLMEAREFVRQHKIGEAWERLDTIVKKYPNTEAAEHAQGMLDRMQKIDEVWGYVKDRQKAADGQSMLSNARNLIRGGKFKEARALLQRIMDECVGTIWAEEAKKEMINLPGK
jgi:hypothetical protein